GSRCPADLEVPRRQRQGLLGVAARSQPELGRVVGEGLGVLLHELLVPRRSDVAPATCGVRLTGLSEYSRELRGVIGIVGAPRQRAEQLDGPFAPAEGRFDLREMALRGRVRWEPRVSCCGQRARGFEL